MQFGQLKRREFISLLGGAATAWPLGVRAQQPERMRRVGILMPLTAEDAYDQARLAAFLQGLQQDGWSVGQNLVINLTTAKALGLAIPESFMLRADEVIE